MTHKEQNRILNDKIESNINQFKVDRLNAEISAFSSSDLNKYEFLTRKDLKYKSNALDKARFEFSPLGKTFSTGLDKTAQCYQEEGVIKLLKDIRDGSRGGVRLLVPNDNNDDDNDDDDNNDDNNNDDDNNDNNDDNNNDDDNNDNNDDDDNNDDNDDDDNNDDDNNDDGNNDDNNDGIIKNLKDKILDLETKLKDSELSNEEKDKLNNEDKDKIYKMLNKFKDSIDIRKMKESIDNFNKKSNDYLDIFNNKISTLNDKISKINDIIKNNEILTNAEKNELQNKIEIINKKNELQENSEVIISQKNNINNEHRNAVELIKKYKESKKYEDNLKTIEKIKELEEDLENAYKAIDMFTSNIHDPNGFDIYMVITKILVINMILTVLIETAIM